MEEIINQELYDNIPEELKALPNWVCWQFVESDGKLTKKPFNISTGFGASSTDSSTWTTFENAISSLDKYDGIGFQFSNSEYFGVDLDNAIDEEGNYNDLYHQLNIQLDTYAEISPSGKGIHLICKGKLPAEAIKRDEIEMYDNARFFTMTGQQISQYNEISECTESIKPFYEKYQKKVTSDVVSNNRTDLSAEEILEKASKATNSTKFNKLFYDGDTSAYNNDDSSADQALANMLVWWTNHDLEMADKLFRQSALYRSKWDSKRGESTYGRTTLEEASRTVNGGYSKKFNLKIKQDVFNYQKPEEPLISRLQRLGKQALDKLIEEWEAEGRSRKKPSSLPAMMIANILKAEIIFVRFNKEQGTDVAMYLEDEGIYTQNEYALRFYIKVLDPNSKRHDADEVIYDLNHTAIVHERTHSKYLIPVNNGIFNLETKQLMPFSPAFIFTSKIATDYVDNPSLPVIDGWNVEEWLDEISCNNPQINQLLWQVISASLNGNYSRNKSIWLVGDGRNGKGTYQELIINIVGLKNVATLKLNEFPSGQSNRFNLTMLEEKVVCIGDDVPANVYIDDSSVFNSVVTSDTVMVERKNKDVYATRFNMTIIQSTNGLPKVHNKTDGNYRRFLIVPFKAKFTEDNDNPSIKEVYLKDKAVLQYVLHKAIHLEFDKFIIPDISHELLEEYKQDNDPIVDFKNNIFDELPHEKILISLVYEYYKEFCNKNGYKFKSNQAFSREFNRLISDKWNNKPMKILSEDSSKYKLPYDFEYPPVASLHRHYCKVTS